ncbi:hypothetical protein HK105_203915 [Polyrhizophydium stewartii]|uniref:Ribosomal protein/NADH dehydrogenase domain-containing protein n=1 Tax=Polyrhizophydium stewartii TaxID=2732419 RepID=A0ABR4NAE2_9FUNG|nr:hypothetical protein HK105_007246 [Polyrhizophydium stewartii]
MSTAAFRSFPVRALQANLTRGRAALQAMPPQLTKVTVNFAEGCPSRAALENFYVNELPRIYHHNQHIKFATTDTDAAESCSIQLAMGERTERLDLAMCQTPEEIYKRMMQRVHLHSSSSAAAPAAPADAPAASA